MSEFPGDETFQQEEPGYPADDPLGLEGDPAFSNGAEPVEGEPDPFAEVPAAEPVIEPGEDLPPGVQEGSLGGVNPSEDAAAAEAEVEAMGAVEPGPGDIADDDLVPADEEPEPLAPEDVGLGDVPPAPAEPDPLLDGDAGPIEEPESEDQPASEEATDQEKLTASCTGGQDNTKLQSEQNETPGAAGKAEDEAPKPPAKPRKRRRGKGPKLAPGQREYTILKFWAAAEVGGQEDHGPLWEEALKDPVVARSGELALRKAFRVLTDNKPGNYTLVPIPTKYWNPEQVEGEVPDAALAIKVGGKKK